jgi:serine/threonine protein kinase/tetratricopeptide (TPR) repeat protein
MSRAFDERLTGMHADADPEILAILDDYLATIEQGKPVELEELLARRPELADELKAYVDSINFLHVVSRELTGLAESTPQLDDWTGHKLGEYEIVRELGRGGMGVVYEAMQNKLGRRVALKVLPLAAVLDKQQTARFLLEAQAAAQLSHPNIVPVYGVGCEQGVHYYSMQYIDGQSLEPVIEGLRQYQRSAESESERRKAHASNTGAFKADTRVGFSTCCSTNDRKYIATVAQFGIQAAEALQHAHDYGPSNLIIDREGKLWVTDFGLARCQADSSITLTGAILGTVRYMSPEQAAGRRGMVDHRTDIYSLGGTLYELLTLRTAYEADNTHDLLRQMESREPAMLRRFNPSIPFDLETIVLKAISKQRRQRYATAQELADDLRCFVNGQPIAARRPSLVDRTAKWAARHKNLVAAAVVVAVLALIGTTAAVILVAREQSATESALAESQRNFERSQKNFKQSRQVLDHFGLLVVDRLAGLPGTEQLRNDVLRDTLRYYDRFIAQAGNDPALRIDLAIACFKSGEMLDRLGAGEKAIASYERARRIFERLEGDEARAHVAACHNNVALVLAAQGKVEAAKDAYGLAIQLYEERIAADASNPEVRLQLASTYGNLALLLANADQRAESLTYHHRALDLQRQLVRSHPERTEFRRELAMTLNNLSYFHRESDIARSVELNQEALDILRQIALDEPDNMDFQSDLALSCANQGSLLAGHREYERAEAAYREAIALYGALLAYAPNAFAYRRDLAVAHNNLGRTLTELGRFKAAQEALEDARGVLQSLSQEAPHDLVVMSSLGGVFNNLGMVHEHSGEYPQAIAAYEQAIALQRSAISRAPKMAAFGDFVNRTYENYARVLAAAGRSEDAAEARKYLHTSVSASKRDEPLPGPVPPAAEGP